MVFNTKEIAKKVSEWIDDKKGYNTEIIDVSELTSLTDIFIITSGSSDRNVQSIADNIEEKAKEEGIIIHHKEGRQGGRWILLDINYIVVHIFHEEERAFYNLERLWSDGKKI
ncbi:MAG: ribosome silencing factor [Eubacteriaceae bacterium]